MPRTHCLLATVLDIQSNKIKIPTAPAAPDDAGHAVAVQRVRFLFINTVYRLYLLFLYRKEKQ